MNSQKLQAGASPRHCCTPTRGAVSVDETSESRVRGESLDAPSLVMLHGNEFTMGNDIDEGFSADGEGPTRRVTVGDFGISRATVTNEEFALFVRQTGYITTAEQCGRSFVFYLQIPEARRPQMRRVASGLQWWLDVEGACWQRPEGPGSDILKRRDYPVVHLSWIDAQIYCEWAGCSLPTEAEWEFAARGGRSGQRYPWGDALEPEGRAQCNIWRGRFPHSWEGEGLPGPMPARSFEPNGYSLYNMCGNVWEWCADWFSVDYHAATSAIDPCFDLPTGRRSLRGGSFLCHDSYCNRYRVAARSSNTPTSSASNIGMRVVRRGGA